MECKRNPLFFFFLSTCTSVWICLLKLRPVLLDLISGPTPQYIPQFRHFTDSLSSCSLFPKVFDYSGIIMIIESCPRIRKVDSGGIMETFSGGLASKTVVWSLSGKTLQSGKLGPFLSGNLLINCRHGCTVPFFSSQSRPVRGTVYYLQSCHLCESWKCNAPKLS